MTSLDIILNRNGHRNIAIEMCKNETLRHLTAISTGNVEVLFGNNDVHVLKQVADYTLEEALADSGGSGGLWIGFSLITMVEIAEFLYQLTTAAKKKHSTSDDNQQSQDESETAELNNMDPLNKSTNL